jgi:hypothetical protein
VSAPDIFGMPGTTGRAAAPVDRGAWAAPREHRYRWVRVAGVVLLVLGALDLIDGLAAIVDLRFVPHRATDIFGSLNVCGWIVVCIGVGAVLVGPRRRLNRIRKPLPALRRSLAARGPDAIDPAEGTEGSPQWLAWRRAAQKMRRAWNECSAAGPLDREGLYRRYTAAAAAEERAAAELELTLHLVAQVESTAGPGDQDGQVAPSSLVESTEAAE